MHPGISNNYKGNTTINWQLLKLIWPYMLEYRMRIAIAMLMLILAKVTSVAGPFLLKHIVDQLDVSTPQAVAIVVPIAMIIAYGMARFGTILFGELRDTIFGRVTERAMRRIGLKVFEHLHGLDLAFHLNRRTGGLARDIERGTTGIGFLMRFFVFNIAPTFIEIALVIGLLLYNYGAGFGLTPLIAIVMYVAYSVYATDWRTRYVREAAEADSRSHSRALDSLLNFETVKYFGNERYEARRYDQDLAGWELARRKNRLSLFVLNGGQSLIIAIAMIAMMSLAGIRVQEGNMTIGDFVLINAFTMQLFMPLNFLGFVYREIKGSMANIEQMFNLLDARAVVRDREGARELQTPQGRVDFDDVGFAYHEGRATLHNVSFTVHSGEKIAIVGASGAGKSTLSKLLFRFYDVTQGAIRIDGQDIRDVSQESLRRAIGIVPQDTMLFNDSILENIRYGKPEANDKEVLEAIQLAHLEHFIADLPDGVHTQVGERGLKLSGGEKQRVAIARTILKRPPIIVFDEATSSLDSRSEQTILTALKEVAKGHTSLVIAHRLSTIVDADRILVLEKGRIAEQGTHEALLASNGSYTALWRAQAREQSGTSGPLP